MSAEETLKTSRELEREERKRKRDDGGAQDVDDVEVAGSAVMHGEVEGWAGAEVDGDELNPEQVKMGRKDELEFMIKKLDMFEFGTCEEAMSRGGKQPTTKWVDRWKSDDEGGRFVRCRLVGRDFKVKGVEEREDLFAAMPPLQSKKLMFRMVAAVREQRRRRALEEVKLMFIDVKKVHLYVRYEGEEWVELPEEFWECGKCSRLRRWLYGMRTGTAGWEEAYAEKLEGEGFHRGKRKRPRCSSTHKRQYGSWWMATTSLTVGRRSSRRSRRR